MAPRLAKPTTLVLPSIPDAFRIRPARFRDAKPFLAEKYAEFQANTEHRHVPVFLKYNPALAPVPRRMKKYLSRHETYFLAMRVTPANNCFRRKYMRGLPPDVWDHTMLSPASLLGFAVLDAEHALLPGEPPARADCVPAVPGGRRRPVALLRVAAHAMPRRRSRRRWRRCVVVRRPGAGRPTVSRRAGTATTNPVGVTGVFLGSPDRNPVLSLM